MFVRDNAAEPAISGRASPIIFAPKSDGSMRFCVDYQLLNAGTVRDSYPIPEIDKCIDRLGLAKMFSIFDANSGY